MAIDKQYEPATPIDGLVEMEPEEGLDIEIQNACWDIVNHGKQLLEKKYSPSGYNIGININEAAGQTIPHLHMHLIPRYTGDQKDPRGGVRWLIPEKAKYW